MSVPQPQEDTAPRSRDALVCPKCERAWPRTEAPLECPTDHAALVTEREWATAKSDPLIGKTLEGRYTLTARIGAGSMGTVYRARQHAMGREVAIKILRGDRAHDEASKARFLREARANSLLASPNTVTVFDFGEAQTGEFYLAMELLEGESIGQRITRVGRLRPEHALETTRQALRSLGEAHAKGVIHRDLKPDNLYYAHVVGGADEPEEIVKVLDFGIAKMVGPLSDQALSAAETQAGTVFGTPRYMSPEQAQGKPLDARSDLYSLGVILYQMLAGRPPFTDDDAVVVMARHIKTPPPPFSEACPDAELSPEIERVVLRVLAKDPNDRPASAEQFAQELIRALEAHRAVTSGVRKSVTTGSQRIMAPAEATFITTRPADAKGARSFNVKLFALAALFSIALGAAFAVVRTLTRDPVIATPSAVVSTSDPAPSTSAPAEPSSPAPPTAAVPPASSATQATPPSASPSAIPAELLPKVNSKHRGATGGGGTGSGSPRPPPKGSASANAPGYGLFE